MEFPCNTVKGDDQAGFEIEKKRDMKYYWIDTIW